jgi:hypothetical protein
MSIVEGREADMERRLRPGHAGMVASLFAALAFFGWSADEAPRLMRLPMALVWHS